MQKRSSNQRYSSHENFLPESVLQSYDQFINNPSIRPYIKRYREDSALANHALKKILDDLLEINQQSVAKNKTPAFTACDGRVKSEGSFFMKFFLICHETHTQKTEITEKLVNDAYCRIHDLCGARFSCPYYHDVIPTIKDIVRPQLLKRGYLVDLQSNRKYHDKDYLDLGDNFGYRSYHFYVKIPTTIDIYGNKRACLCEIQARTELQHVWAVKSHDLLYKPDSGWTTQDLTILNDLKQVSNNLRAADEFIDSIRTRLNNERIQALNEKQ